jgi:hypothetical protein
MLLLATMVPAARAAVFPVSAGPGTPIQDAIDAASDGDQILVGPGTFREALDYGGKAITVRGTSAALTIIDPAGLVANAVTFATGEGAGSLLADLTVRNGDDRGVLIIGASPRISGVVFDQLGRDTSSGFNGGSIFIDGGAPEIENSTFTGSEAWLGGAIYATGGASFTVLDSGFQGGAANSGGAIYASGGFVALDSVDIAETTTPTSGSAVYLAGGADAEFVAVTVEDNDATNADYGTVYIAAGGSLDDVGGRYSNNYGQVMHAVDAEVSLDRTIIEGTTGEALYGVRSVIHAQDIVVQDNLGNPFYHRHALYLDSCTFDEVRSLYLNNDGGGLHIFGAASGPYVTVDSSWIGNAAPAGGRYGGGIKLEDIPFEVVIENAVFVDNAAAQGGALWMSGNAPLRVVGGQFLGNEAHDGGIYASDNGGAAIYAGGYYLADGSDLTLQGVVFADNFTNDGGGAVRTEHSDLLVFDSTFERNKAGAGGAIYFGFAVNPSYLMVQSTDFRDNDVEGSAGAIYVRSATSATVEDCVFENNGADGTDPGQTGGAYYQSDNVYRQYLYANRFCGNHSWNAGAIYTGTNFFMTPGGEEWSGNLFQDNSAVGEGGALSLDDHRGFPLSNNTFVGNSASAGGGGVIVFGTEVGVINNVFAFQPEGDAFWDTPFGAMAYNDWFANSLGDLGGGLSAGAAFGAGTLFDDPQFVRWSADGRCNDDLSPGMGSPLVDAGSPTVLDTDGTVSDIGFSGGPWGPSRDRDADGYPAWNDCNDENAAMHPGAVEVWYDGVNQDCLDLEDFDQDYDGFTRGRDCDDTDPTAYPGGVEVWYDGIDSDCDGADDFDRDLDGAAGGGGPDCDDLDAGISPAAADSWYDGVDSDCDGADDFDQDGDGDPLLGVGADCDDTDPTRSGLQAEIWYDGIDQDCAAGDDFDQDGDGVRSPLAGGADCDDADAATFPGAPELWYDGVDQDCLGGNDNDADGDGYDGGPFGVDCDDAAPTAHPGGLEVWYDGLDGDCDGADDFDRDLDGDRVPAGGGGDCDDLDPTRSSLLADSWYDGIDTDCAGDDDYDQDGDGAPIPADCDDLDATVSPTLAETWYDGIDQDCSGGSDFDSDGDGAAGDGGPDCADDDPQVHPGAADPPYDGLDANCDGASEYDVDGDGENAWCTGTGDVCDDSDPLRRSLFEETWYDGIDGDCDGESDYDQDRDGADDAAHGGGDCDDLDARVGPSAIELWYDGIDQDCSGTSDFDRDGDGHDAVEHSGDDCLDLLASAFPGAPEVYYDGVDEACDGGDDFDQDGDGFTSSAYGGTDCNDMVPSSYPGATEIWYDGADQDCLGGSDFDQDGDGYDDAAHGGTDCDDLERRANPGAEELWYDGVDSDCDGASDYDFDRDGYDGVVGPDCNDEDPAIHPGATEIWYDGVDGDCDRAPDDDRDGDGFAGDGGPDCDDLRVEVNPGATEEWYDGADGDCDGGSDYDADGDGADSADFGGDDCDDGDASVIACEPSVDAEAGSAGCRTVSAGGGGWAIALGLGALARRRRNAAARGRPVVPCPVGAPG